MTSSYYIADNRDIVPVKSTMTDVKDEQIHDVFAAFDDSGDGTIRLSDLRSALSLLGMDITEAELRDSFNDATDNVTEEEFTKYIKECLRQVDFQSRCTDCFNYLNEDNKGTISRALFKSILTQRGTDPIGDEQAELLMTELGIEGDEPFNVADIVDTLYQRDYQL